MNKGEFAEKQLIAILASYRNQTIDQILNKKIKTIHVPKGSELIEVLNYKSNISAEYLAKLNPTKLNQFCIKHNITKAGAYSKADVYINHVGYSIKYTHCAPPAIINHTNRLGWQFAAKHMKTTMTGLDQVIEEYWVKRLSGLIGEDSSTEDENSPFKNKIEVLRPFLEYFSFEGTGSRLSHHPAEAVIEFSDPKNIDTYKLLKKSDFIDEIWSRLVFSVRSKKGMPGDINSPRIKPSDKKSILKWSKEINRSLKGALHVRLR